MCYWQNSSQIRQFSHIATNMKLPRIASFEKFYEVSGMSSDSFLRFYGQHVHNQSAGEGIGFSNLYPHRITDAIGLPAGMPDHGEARGFESVIPARQARNRGKAVGGACVRPDEEPRARDVRNASVHAFADSLGEAYRHVSRGGIALGGDRPAFRLRDMCGGFFEACLLLFLAC